MLQCTLRKTTIVVALALCLCLPVASAADAGNQDRAGLRNFCINRHDRYINSLFLDWSVRKIGLKDLWTLKWQEDTDTAGSKS